MLSITWDTLLDNQIREALYYLKNNPYDGFREVREFLEAQRDPFTRQEWLLIKAGIVQRFFINELGGENE